MIATFLCCIGVIACIVWGVEASGPLGYGLTILLAWCALLASDV